MRIHRSKHVTIVRAFGCHLRKTRYPEDMRRLGFQPRCDITIASWNRDLIAEKLDNWITRRMVFHKESVVTRLVCWAWRTRIGHGIQRYLYGY